LYDHLTSNQNGSFQRICKNIYYVKEKVEVWKGNTKIVVKVKIMMKVKLMCPFHIHVDYYGKGWR
jgi:hypothetical protein